MDHAGYSPRCQCEHTQTYDSDFEGAFPNRCQDDIHIQERPHDCIQTTSLGQTFQAGTVTGWGGNEQLSHVVDALSWLVLCFV